jgi:hypothetical protein
MFIAGITEIILIGAVLFAARLVPKQAGKFVQVGYLMALCVIALAAFLGGLRFLELVNTLSYHSVLTHFSKHLAMPIFVVCALWHHLRSGATRWFAKLLMLLALFTCLLNLKFQVAWLSDVIIVAAILFAAFQVRSLHRASLAVLLGLMLLMSNLLWKVIIESESLRIGIFHLCLGGFFILLAKSLSSTWGGNR